MRAMLFYRMDTFDAGHRLRGMGAWVTQRWPICHSRSRILCSAASFKTMRHIFQSVPFHLALAILLSAAGSRLEGGRTQPAEVKGGNSMALTLISTAFANGAAIPKRYTCDADDLSPALQWTGAPTETQSLALIGDDPDAPAGTWTHWLIWNIPQGARQLPEAVPKTETLENGATQGLNDFKRIGYGGPCPPPGRPHRYLFKLYALNARLDLRPGASRADLEQALKAHILAQAELMGTYHR